MTKRNTQLGKLIYALALTGSLVGCGEDGGSNSPAPPPPVVVPPTPVPPPSPPPTPPPPPPPAGLVRPNASNTGFPAGMALLSWTGPQTDARSGIVIDGYDLPRPSGGYYIFTGNNLILRNCRINGGVLFSGDNIRVERCEIIGGLSLSGTANATVEYNNIHDISDDGIHVTSDSGQVRTVTIAHNFVHTYVYPAAIACNDPHSDGIQVRGADGLTLLNNVFDMGRWQTICNGRFTPLSAAIFLEPANGGNRNITVDRNYLNGSAIVLRIGQGPNTRIIGNRFGRDERFGLVSNDSQPGDIIEKSGNVRDDTGEPVNF
ncbi:MAG: right-handed parallel beta-helix repeat-containing protein [Sphingorhabdus sp.]|uniref:right-handed parallel beta-helix repeat-containing protein n=1 Tax=Sphingorhabdus sp. TaxID=1902408 RepID=UPI003CA76AF8